MAEIFRLPCHFLRQSSPLLPSVFSFQLGVQPKRYSDGCFCSDADSAAAPAPLFLRHPKRLLSFKLCKTAEEHPDILFLKVNFDDNKPMCKSLNVKVLPYFHFYRGADGQLESFSCSLVKFQRIKDAIATHNTARCSIGPP